MDDDSPVPAHRRREIPPVPAITTYTPGTEPPAIAADRRLEPAPAAIASTEEN